MTKTGEKTQKLSLNYSQKDNMAMYDNFAKTFSKSRKNLKWAEIDAILEILKNENLTKILDIGCGSGRFLENYKNFFVNSPELYLGLDASENMIIEAKKNLENENEKSTKNFFEVCEMQKLEKFFEKNNFPKFDAIIFLASFHHLENENERIEVLKSAKKILNENWKIFLTNWNLLGQEKYQNSHLWNSDFKIKIGEFDRYYHGFKLEELEKIFEKCELKIEKNEIFEGWRNIFSILKN